MNCFPCFSSQRSNKSFTNRDLPVAQATGPDSATNPPVSGKPRPSVDIRHEKDGANITENENENVGAKNFNFRELAAATKNFRQECLLGEGGFGRVFKGTLQATGKVVAVKQLDRNGMQGNKEFQAEVLKLGLLHHPNLVHLLGYCADGDQRLLVYEYMPLGSIEEHLHDTSEDKKPLDWVARMKIASGAAQGLEYLHEKANPPVIYRDLKSSNIMFDEEFNPRLSDYGLANLGLGGGKTHISPRVMGTYGYCAPEYERTGELTLKSDVYSFGVFLLELITGRRAIDTTRSMEEQNLVSWAQPFFRDPKRFPEMADPALKSNFPVRSLNQAVGVAAMCLQEEPLVRPLIGDVLAALSFLTVPQSDDGSSPLPVANLPSEVEISSEPGSCHNKGGLDSPNGQNGGSASHRDGDHRNHEDEHSSESSYSEDGGSVDHQEEDISGKPQGQNKKTVKWASKCKSSRSSSRNSNVEDESSTLITKSNSGVKCDSNSRQESNVQPQDGSVDSCSSHKSYIEPHDGSSSQNSISMSKVKSQNGSVSSSSSNDSCFQFEAESSVHNSRSNGTVGHKYEDFGYNSRQDSTVQSPHGSNSFDLRSNSNVEWQYDSAVSSLRRNSNGGSRDESVRSSSAGDWSSRHYSNMTSQDSRVGSSTRSNSDAGSEDGSVGSKSWRHGNMGSHHEHASLS